MTPNFMDELAKSLSKPGGNRRQGALAFVTSATVRRWPEEVIGTVNPDQLFISSSRVFVDRDGVFQRQNFAIAARADVECRDADAFGHLNRVHLARRARPAR